MSWEEDGVTVWCSRCGDRFTDEETAVAHPKSCRQPRLYWWPRENPWHLAALAFIVGVIVGVLPW